MLSSPRRPDTTIRIFSSAVYCLRVLRRISRTVLSAGSFLLIDFWLIFVPFGHYDEPEILRYAITSIRPKGADVRQRATAAAALALSLHFDRLEAGFKRLQQNQLSVSVAPALAWKWLAPRMQGLYERSPHIDLRMDTSLRLADIAGGEFDLAIRYGPEEGEGLKTIPLFQEYLLPVCIPSLRTAGQSATGEAAILDLSLLHIEGETSDASVRDWRHWGEIFGLLDPRLDEGPRYPQSAMALQAAFDGQGVALCGLTLVIDDLIAGRLVTPYRPARAVKTDYAYRLVASPVRRQSATQTTFMRWIEQEAQRTRDQISDYRSRAGVSLTE